MSLTDDRIEEIADAHYYVSGADSEEYFHYADFARAIEAEVTKPCPKCADLEMFLTTQNQKRQQAESNRLLAEAKFAQLCHDYDEHDMELKRVVAGLRETLEEIAKTSGNEQIRRIAREALK